MTYFTTLEPCFQSQSFATREPQNQSVHSWNEDEARVPLTGHWRRWGNFYSRKGSVKKPPSKHYSSISAKESSRSGSQEYSDHRPEDDGCFDKSSAEKDPGNAPECVGIYEKASHHLRAKRSSLPSWQVFETLPSATSSFQDGFNADKENGIKSALKKQMCDTPYMEDSSLGSDVAVGKMPKLNQSVHACSSNVTRRNSGSVFVISEEKNVVGFKAMRTPCTCDKQLIERTSAFAETGLHIATPSYRIATVTGENDTAEFDNWQGDVVALTVPQTSSTIPLHIRSMNDRDALWSIEVCEVNGDKHVEKSSTYSTKVADVVDSPFGVENQVYGLQLVPMGSPNKCLKKNRSIKRKRREKHASKDQQHQVNGSANENWGQSNESIGVASDSYTDSPPLLNEIQSCSEGAMQMKDTEDLGFSSPQKMDDCHPDACEPANYDDQANKSGPFLRRRICLQTNVTTSMLKKHQRRMSTSTPHKGTVHRKTTLTSFKGTLSRKSSFLHNRFKKVNVKGLLEDYLKGWNDRHVEAGGFESEHCFPFLVRAPRRVECHQCKVLVFPGSEVLCTSVNCRRAYHLVCAKQLHGHCWSKKNEFKCPQHVCMVCRSKRRLWRCERCPVAVHAACSPWPEAMTFLRNKPGPAICWRHHEDWRLELKHEDQTNDIQEAFHRLPVPYLLEDFKIDRSFWKDVMENENEPPPYIHIRRNVFLIKKKRDDTDDGVGCFCGRDATICGGDCECRVQSMSCSKACHCSEVCTNRPFRKEKKIKIVKTRFCGWGAEAGELIKKGEFVIEYTGEVINDALCEERLWAMKYKGVNNFYMCEIGKDFIIDATFKGNPSRYLNHSCDPNCKLEKWRVDGETRVGVFAAKDISIGDPLTYDYRFIQFGPNVKCCCGAANCQGDLGEPFGANRVKAGCNRGETAELVGRSNAKTPFVKLLEWGCKRKRSLLDGQNGLLQEHISYGYCTP